MKKILPALFLILALTACNGEPSPTDSTLALSPKEAAQTLLDSGAFSESLEIIDNDVAAPLYGVDGESIQDSACYLSTGATAEECAFLLFAGQEEADAALEGFSKRVEAQTEALQSYQPAEIGKLEKAMTGTLSTQEGTLVYLVVANDSQAAQNALDSLGK